VKWKQRERNIHLAVCEAFPFRCEGEEGAGKAEDSGQHLTPSCAGSHRAAHLEVPGAHTRHKGILLHLAVSAAFELGVHIALL